MADPKRVRKVRHAPRGRGIVFNLKIERNMKIIDKIEEGRFTTENMKDIVGGAGSGGACIDYCKSNYTTTQCVAGYHNCPKEYSTCDGQPHKTCFKYAWKTDK